MTRPLLEQRIFVPRYIAGWILFTGAAGFVNAAAFMASNSLVSHVTGSVTHIATKSSVALHLLGIVLAFLAGAMLAFLASETLKKNPVIAYALPPIVACAVLVGISVGGRVGVFGEFAGEDDVTGEVFPMLALLAFAMGTINASIGAATANRIRVTHMMGPATDIAGHIVRGVLRDGESGRTELKWAFLRIAMLASFIAGAFVAARLAVRVEYDVFLFGAAVLFAGVGFTGTHAAQESENDGLAPASHAAAR